MPAETSKQGKPVSPTVHNLQLSIGKLTTHVRGNISHLHKNPIYSTWGRRNARAPINCLIIIWLSRFRNPTPAWSRQTRSRTSAWLKTINFQPYLVSRFFTFFLASFFFKAAALIGPLAGNIWHVYLKTVFMFCLFLRDALRIFCIGMFVC